MKKTNSNLFVYYSMTFVVCMVLSNILAAKLLAIGNYSITAGVIIFPISYIINDVLSEVYGYEKAKKVIIAGFLLELLMVIAFYVAIFLPSPEWFKNSEAFALILGSTPRIAIASLISYLLGSLVNSKVLVVMKNKSEKMFGLRAIASTIFGEAVDSFAFAGITFIGVLPIKEIISMIFLLVVFKTIYEIVCLPVTYLVVKKTKEYEKEDTN